MRVLSACPTDDVLRRLGSDSMSETKFVSLEVHVQGCDQCQARLEWLASEDVRVEAAEPLRPPELSVPPSVPGFVIEHELGRGGMGVVDRAWQPNLARHVAIKFLKGRAAAHTQERDRWLKEAQSLCACGTGGSCKSSRWVRRRAGCTWCWS